MTHTAETIRAEAIRQSYQFLDEVHDATDDELEEVREGIRMLEAGEGRACVRWSAGITRKGSTKAHWSHGIYVAGFGHIAIDAHAIAVRVRDGRLNVRERSERQVRRQLDVADDVNIEYFKTRSF